MEYSVQDALGRLGEENVATMVLLPYGVSIVSLLGIGDALTSRSEAI